MRSLYVILASCLILSACKLTTFRDDHKTVSDGGAIVGYHLDLEPKDLRGLSKIVITINGMVLDDMQSVSISSNAHFMVNGEIYADAESKSLNFSKYVQTHLDTKNSALHIDIFKLAPTACFAYEHNAYVEVKGVCLKNLNVEVPTSLKVIVKRSQSVPVQYEVSNQQIISKSFYGDTIDELLTTLREYPNGYRQIEAIEGYMHDKPGRIFYVKDIEQILDCSSVFERDVIQIISGRIIDIENVGSLKHTRFIWQEDLDRLAK